MCHAITQPLNPSENMTFLVRKASDHAEVRPKPLCQLQTEEISVYLI